MWQILQKIVAGGTVRSALCAVIKTIENDNTKERRKGRECLCSPSVLVVMGEKISPSQFSI